MDQMDADMWWTVLKEAAMKWSSHKDARQGAALAYYSVFSLGHRHSGGRSAFRPRRRH
jgi:uncharacterized BrkB/YihY/UPF0761 family membrane protein